MIQPLKQYDFVRIADTEQTRSLDLAGKVAMITYLFGTQARLEISSNQEARDAFACYRPGAVTTTAELPQESLLPLHDKTQKLD